MKGTELADAIRDEMTKAGNGYIEMMGEMMTEYLRIHPETEIDGKKNLKGAFGALKGVAQKKQKGGCYAMPPQEVYSEMMIYFGLPHADADFRAVMAALIGATAMGGQAVSEKCEAITRRHEKAEPAAADEFDLDALLGV